MRKLLIAIILFLKAGAVDAQSFSVTQSVIAGGGTQSAAGGFTLVGTVGQHLAEFSTSPDFALRSGFWMPEFAPTAAPVAISGRVTTADGSGITNVRITLTDLGSGSSSSAVSSSLGYYRFDDVAIGGVYLLAVSSKRFTFEPDNRVISVVDEIVNEDFVAIPK